MNHFPAMAATRGRVEPAPRRVRASLGGRTVLDTTGALYGWEVPYYPQYYVPRGDIADEILDDDAMHSDQHLGTDELAGFVRLRWDALDAWFEEDEEVFVHPRNPYVRADALRSDRFIRVELDGVVLAESSRPVLLFETGLPTRYYLDRADVRWEHLEPSSAETSCPYKGTTTDYWSVRTPRGVHVDLAWSYRSPLAAVANITGLVAFYDEKVDVTLDGIAQSRPVTKFV